MKKHSPEEVTAKLRYAGELAERGLSQVEICNALGISVMTFHRWRKAPSREYDRREDKEATATPVSSSLDHGKQLRRLRDLQLENQQLRKLVTDLMLEKLQMKERAISPTDQD